MTRYELLQALEMMYPSREDWFIADEDEGVVRVCFNIDTDTQKENRNDNEG